MTTRMIRMTVAGVLLAVAGAAAFASTDYGAAGALGKTGLSAEQMLTYAIQDEYLARAEYQLIMDRYGSARPFSNIVRAEGQHVEWVSSLFQKYGYAVPSDTAKSLVRVPADMKSALQAGVDAEIANIAMYDAFLNGASAQPLQSDVRALFEELKRASENHLAAFRTNLARYR